MEPKVETLAIEKYQKCCKLQRRQGMRSVRPGFSSSRSCSSELLHEQGTFSSTYRSFDR